MRDRSGPSHFRALFEAAFRDYEKQTGKILANHPFAEKLQSCDSVESVTAVLRELTELSGEIGGKGKVLKPLKNVLSVLHKLFSTPAVNFGQHLGLVRPLGAHWVSMSLAMYLPPVTAIHTGLGILLSSVKGVLDDYDTLADLLESVEHFLNRLDIYTAIPPTDSMTEMIIKILVQLLSILALATKQLQQGKLKALVKKQLFGGKDIEAVLRRLDRLTWDEARITAAQTLEVVHGLFQNMRKVVDDGETSIKQVRDALEILQKLASDKNKSDRDKLVKDIRTWLSPPDPWKNYNIARMLRQRGSAEWFFRGNTISEWKASEAPDSLLWVHGKPGAGKSVLFSAIVEDIDAMQKAGLASLALFYYDFREDQKKDLRGLLSSLLVQLCHQSDSYCEVLSKFYSEHDNGSRYPGDDALARCLKDLLKLPRHAPVYLLVDALDECPNTSSIPSPRDNVLNLIEDLIKSRFSHLHVCVTSRPETDIKDFLDPLVSYAVSLHDESGQKRDIEEYIKSVINTNPKNKKWKAADKELVIDVLTRKADGMFRWVYCQLVYICGCIPARIRHALTELPETLDETYERTLREINKADWDFAHRLFQFVTVAVRPLRVEELAELLAFDFKTGSIPKFHEDWRLEDPMHAVLSICPSFLAIADDKFHSDRKVVQFSHFSVKEFLTSVRLAEANDIILRRYHISETPAHTLAAGACLGFLLHVNKYVTNDGLRELPFIEYSSEYWVNHARLEDVSRKVEDGLKDLFDPSKPHLEVCVWICDPRLHPRERSHRPERPSPLRGTPLHYAALWDLHSIVELLINEHAQDVNSQDFADSATPLHVALNDGHMKVARRLLECHADAKAQNKDKETPLHLASRAGQLEVACMLIDRGADMSAQDKNGQTPFHLALQMGKVGVARMLIEHGADVSSQDEDGQAPLHLALRMAQLEVARMLIEHGADVSAQDKDGRTPLQLALRMAQLEIACLIIEHGVDVSAQDKDGRTPLHLASQAGRLEVARMLIERRSDVSAQDRDGRTPLHLASQEGQLVARMLIEHGADVSARDKDGQTPLHLASLKGRLEVARMLIEHGADVSTQDKDGQTLLHLASQAGRVEIARMLIEYGMDVSGQDKDGQTPFDLASRAGRLDVARMLIKHGVSVSVQNEYGQTLLHLASQAGRLAVVRLLIELGASVSAQDKDGQTPLHLASQAGRQDVVHMLIARGAGVLARNNVGQTPLHLASQTGRLEAIRPLIWNGVGVLSQDNDGQTPLHLASQAGRREVARTLIARGASVSIQNKDGQTPLHLVFLGNWDTFSAPPGLQGVARILIECGADVSTQDKEGRTPMHLASQVGRLEVIRKLLGLVHSEDASAEN